MMPEDVMILSVNGRYIAEQIPDVKIRRAARAASGHTVLHWMGVAPRFRRLPSSSWSPRQMWLMYRVSLMVLFDRHSGGIDALVFGGGDCDWHAPPTRTTFRSFKTVRLRGREVNTSGRRVSRHV